MKEKLLILITKLIRLTIAYLILSLGIALMLKSELGLSSWGTLDQGLSVAFGTSFGAMTQRFGFIIVILNGFMGMLPGVGTILNILEIGFFVDVFTSLLKDFVIQGLIPRMIFLLVGLILSAIGSGYYISINLGAGPRDGFTVNLSKILKIDFAPVRVTVELIAVAVGYLLGGTVGIGTILAALLTGPIMGRVMKFLNYNSKTAEPEDILDTIRSFKKVS